jgi:chemotaxis signal transduction protein
MASAEPLFSERISMVVVRAAGRLYALPLASVIETLRCPAPIAVAGAPECVAGVAMIRGATVAVVDLGVLLGADRAARGAARLVTLRVGQRTVGLAVQAVIGVREFERAELAAVPPLLQQARPEVMTAVGALDRELLLVLDGSRILSAEALDLNG